MILKIPQKRPITNASEKSSPTTSSPIVIINITKITSSSNPLKYLRSKKVILSILRDTLSSKPVGVKANNPLRNISSSRRKKKVINKTEKRPTIKLPIVPAIDPNRSVTSDILKKENTFVFKRLTIESSVNESG